MPIRHVEARDRPFVVLDKQCSNDPDLSWKAKGVHTYIMGLPPGWEINITDLEKRSKDGRDSVRTAIHELERAGYLDREKARGEHGRMDGWMYNVYERADMRPAENESTEMGKPVVGEPNASK